MGKRINRLNVFTPSVDPATPGGITVQPGSARTLIDIKNLVPTGTVTRILIMGVTQHPNTLYSYAADGKGFSLPFPLGTLINPLYCKDQLGGYLEFQDEFAIAIQNNDTKPHLYSAIIITEPTVTPY